MYRILVFVAPLLLFVAVFLAFFYPVGPAGGVQMLPPGYTMTTTTASNGTFSNVSKSVFAPTCTNIFGTPALATCVYGIHGAVNFTTGGTICVLQSGGTVRFCGSFGGGTCLVVHCSQDIGSIIPAFRPGFGGATSTPLPEASTYYLLFFSTNAGSTISFPQGIQVD